jgi:hypothetical protein
MLICPEGKAIFGLVFCDYRLTDVHGRVVQGIIA